MTGTEFDLGNISSLEGTIIIPRENLKSQIETIKNQPVIEVPQHEYDMFRQQERIVGHTDLFYRFGRASKPAGKFGEEVVAGISPIVVNSTFFEGQDSEITRLAIFRAKTEIANIALRFSDYFSPRNVSWIHTENSIKAWISTFQEAEQTGRLNDLIAFYQKTLSKSNGKLSSDAQFDIEELSLMNRGLEEYSPSTLFAHKVRGFISRFVK